MKMTQLRMLGLLEGIDDLLRLERRISVEPLIQCIIRESRNMGIDGCRIRNIEPTSLAKIESYLQEVQEQMTVNNFAAALTLVRQLRDMIERCGLESRLAGPPEWREQ